MEALGKFTAFILGLTSIIASLVLLILLKVHIIYDIADLYSFWPITLIPIEWMVGFMYILALLHGKKKVKKDKAIKEWPTYLKLIKPVIEYTIFLLTCWGISYFVHWIIFT